MTKLVKDIIDILSRFREQKWTGQLSIDITLAHGGIRKFSVWKKEQCKEQLYN